jgi:hypothetical protein
MSTTGSSAKVDWYLEKIRRLADERLTSAQTELFEPFASQYFARTAIDDLAARPPEGGEGRRRRRTTRVVHPAGDQTEAYRRA